MNGLQEKTLHQLTGKSNISTIDAEELFNLAMDYPYFSVAQFFLSQKMQEQKQQGFAPQLQKTALYFNNVNLLQYQLLHHSPELKIVYKKEAVEPTEPLLKNVIEEEINAYQEKNAAVEASTMHIPTVESVKEMLHGIQNQNLEREIDTQDEIIETEEKAQESITSFALSQSDNKIETANTKQQEEIIEETKPEETESIIEVIDTPIEAANTTFHEEIIEENPITNEPIEEPKPEENEPIIEVTDTPTEAANTTFHEEIVEENPVPIEETEDTVLQDDKIASILKEQLKEFKKPVEADAVVPLTPESYHTVDYFASQGIKPEFGQQGQDKLSKQLRKFTDWLKHMKNEIPNTDDLGTDPELETAIQDIAKISNEAKEIVTETMAEVLEKQGKKDKAIQLYIKLSFLNPDKSAYFASKIQHLKGI